MMFGKNDGIGLVVDDIPEGSVGVEIGVWRGDSSEQLLRKAGFLYLVDPWSVSAYHSSDEFGDYAAYLKRYSKLVGSASPDDFEMYYYWVYRSVVDRFRDDPVEIHRVTSADFFESFDDRVDWVYLDGSHSHDGVMDDLIGAAEITDVIYGDDYGTKPGVTSAVDEFINSDVQVRFYALGKRQYKITLGD